MSNAAEMDAQEIINYIATAPKKTPVKLYVREKPGMKVQWGNAHVYGGRRGKTVFGDWDGLKAILDANADSIDYYDVENDCRNSAVPMLDLKGINARIEPGAIIRDRVEIGDRAVIMMGAIINIGSVIGEGSMIDMGAVLGGRATVGKNCHIGAGTVLAGVVEPASATPVIIEDDVMIGANAVVLEGVHVGKGAVVAAGAVCVEDVPAGAVVADGQPAAAAPIKVAAFFKVGLVKYDVIGQFEVAVDVSVPTQMGPDVIQIRFGGDHVGRFFRTGGTARPVPAGRNVPCKDGKITDCGDGHACCQQQRQASLESSLFH